jgi:hypothetical protein
MKIILKWVGLRRDLRYKEHLWAIVEILDGTLYNGSPTYFFAWGPGAGSVNLTRVVEYSKIFERKRRKTEDGYREITQNSVESRYPEFMKDISQLMLIEKLKDGGNKTT